MCKYVLYLETDTTILCKMFSDFSYLIQYLLENFDPKNENLRRIKIYVD